MKHVLVVCFFCSIVFLLGLPAYAPYISSSSGGFITPPCSCCPPMRMLGTDCINPDIILSQDFEDAVSGCGSTAKELSDASAYARPISRKITALLKRFEAALGFQTTRCKSLLESGVARLETEISRLQSKACSESVTTGCVPPDVVTEFVPKLQESLQEIKTVLDTDDDGNDVPDLCRGCLKGRTRCR